MQLMILGMHRSGTSTVARCLNLMGAYFAPDEHHMVAQVDNPKGFWERRDVVALNDAILTAAGGSWQHPADLDFDRITVSARAIIQRQLQDVLTDQEAHRPWFIKDPRLCLVLPFWRRFVERPICILVHRNPIEIARSLRARNGFSVPYGLALWECYITSALQASVDLHRLQVSYQELVENPVKVIHELHDALVSGGVRGLSLPTARAVESFVDSELRHQTASDDDIDAHASRAQHQLASALADGSILLRDPPALSRESGDLLRQIGTVQQRGDITAQGAESARVEARQHEARSGELQKMLGTLDGLIPAVYSSWRWRLGDTFVSMVERLLRRGGKPAAMEETLRVLERFRRSASIGGRLRPAPVDREMFTQQKMQELQAFLESDERLDFAQPDPLISVLIVLYNRAELTLACLRSLLSCTSEAIEVVIVDNDSTDRTAELLDRIDGATIVANDNNVGFLRACNQAASLAVGDYLLLLNNDAQLVPGSLEAAVEVLGEDLEVGAVGGKIVLLDGTLQEAGSIIWSDGSCAGYGRGESPDAPEHNFRRDVDYCSGALLLTRRRLFEELDGFDLVFAPAYYEETDYCIRLWERGWRVVYEPCAEILHYEFASSESPASSIEQQKINRKRFCEKHHERLTRHLAPAKEKVLQARTALPRRSRVLFVDDRVPHNALGSGFPRSNRIVWSLVQLGYQVTVYPLNFPAEDGWDTAYSDLPREVELMLGHGRSELADFLQSRSGYYDVIFISRPHNMKLFTDVAKRTGKAIVNARIVYDAEAIFALRNEMKQELGTGRRSALSRKAGMSAEIRLTKGADLVFAVSERERRLFEQGGAAQTAVLGHAIDVPLTTTPFAGRRGFLFVGNLSVAGSPNVDSLVWFVREVLPALDEELGERLPIHVVGANDAREVQSLATGRVLLHGRVDDLAPYFEQARVFVAPTRFAAGIPHKIHEAAGRGLPVVATSLLVEQLGWSCDQDLLGCSCKDPVVFAHLCGKLHRDERLWSRLRENALCRVREECSPGAFVESLRQGLDAIGVAG